MSHRDSVTAPPRRRTRHGLVRDDPDRGVRGRRARTLRRPVPPGGRAHPPGTADAGELPLRRRGRRPGVDARGGDRGAGRADPRAGRLRARDLRALGRRRLGGRRTPRAQGGRRPADVRVRRPRPVARERGGAGRRDVRPPLPRPARPRRRAGAVPHAPRRRHGAGGEARDRRRGVHPRLRGGGPEAVVRSREHPRLGRRPLPRPGNALFGRDRVRRRGRCRGQDQVAPQRRRPAGGHEDGARRAAAVALQGRGAPRRRAARAARADGVAPPVPRTRVSRSGSSATSPRSVSRSSAPPTRSCSRRSAAPASTASSGSASRCCPRCGRSACRATSGRTPTRS